MTGPRNKLRQRAVPPPPGRETGDESFFDPASVASCNECTGILPASVETDSEGENVAALQGIHRIRGVRDQTKRQPW